MRDFFRQFRWFPAGMLGVIFFLSAGPVGFSQQTNPQGKKDVVKQETLVQTATDSSYFSSVESIRDSIVIKIQKLIAIQEKIVSELRIDRDPRLRRAEMELYELKRELHEVRKKKDDAPRPSRPGTREDGRPCT